MRILITNDDGVTSKGILALYNAYISLFIIFSLDYKNLIMSIKPLTEDFITTYKEKINNLFIELVSLLAVKIEASL